MRRVISGMKASLDGKIEGPDGVADWVQAWSEDYGLSHQIDACLVGGGMYPHYEQYWTAIQENPDTLHPMTNRLPTSGEKDWARVAERTTHYVVSKTLTSAHWPRTSFLRGVEDVASLIRQAGKDIYLMGGARLVSGLIDAGLVDELRLLVYPLIAGDGKALFATARQRRALELKKAEQLEDGRVSLIYSLCLTP
jgi:dihydrofolate reductase